MSRSEIKIGVITTGEVNYHTDVVDKKIFSMRDSFKISSNGILGPFITTLAAVVIDMKFHQNNK